MLSFHLRETNVNFSFRSDVDIWVPIQQGVCSTFKGRVAVEKCSSLDSETGRYIHRCSNRIVANVVQSKNQEGQLSVTVFLRGHCFLPLPNKSYLPLLFPFPVLNLADSFVLLDPKLSPLYFSVLVRQSIRAFRFAEWGRCRCASKRSPTRCHVIISIYGAVFCTTSATKPRSASTTTGCRLSGCSSLSSAVTGGFPFS